MQILLTLKCLINFRIVINQFTIRYIYIYIQTNYLRINNYKHLLLVFKQYYADIYY